MVVQSAKKNQTKVEDNKVVRPKSNVQMLAKKMPNHISRQKLVTNQNLVRNVKRHKMVLKELVEENNFEIIAQKKSTFLNKVLTYSKGFKMFTNFSQLAVQIRSQGTDYDLNQTLEETLTKFLTLANRCTISKRGNSFYYLFEYKSLKSFLVDLREKKANLENLCNFGKKKNLIQCTYNLHEAYNQLFLYFNDLGMAVVSSPEFKDKYEEQINEKYISKLNKQDIEKITQQYQKNIIAQSDKNIEKLKKMINDMFHRKTNIVSNIRESKLIKDKIIDKIVQFLNNKIYIRKSKDQLFNFYSYHFVVSMDHLLGPVFIAERDQHLPGLVAPYRCYVYERSKVEDLLKDIQSLQDYLKSIKDKTFKVLKKNLKQFQAVLENLDNGYSENFLLEQLKDINRKFTSLKAKSGQRTTKNINIRSGLKPVVIKKRIANQKMSLNLKKKVLERIIGFHTKVPKSRFVKRILYFRKSYDVSKINKERSCERSFYNFLEAAADMLIGSESLDYKGDEIRIFGYVYRYDFYNKLYQKMRVLQDCLRNQPMTKTNEEVKQAYQSVIERYNQILRLNHDYVELEIQFNIAAIRKKLNGDKEPLNDFISDEEKNKIELYKDHLRKKFYQSRGIVEEPSNKIQPDLVQPSQMLTERTNQTTQRVPLDVPNVVQLDKFSSDSEEQQKNIIQKVKHKNVDLSFQSDSDSFEMSEEQMNKEIEDLNREIQKYEKINKNAHLSSDSSQMSDEQLQLLEENSYDDTSDEQEYIKQPMDLSNLGKSKMIQILLKLNEIDQQQQNWNQYKTYQRTIYYLIQYINEINLQVEDNSFNEGKRGTWVVLKFPEDNFNSYILSLKTYINILGKFYTIEADQLKYTLTLLLTYINQEFHQTKGFYYERYFIQGEENPESDEEQTIDLSKVPNYNGKLNIDKIKISKLHPILVQITFDANQKFLYLAQENEDPEDLQEDLDKLIDTLNDILNDDNLILKSKFNQKKNRYINYGIFRYSSVKYNELEKNINKLIGDLDNKEDEPSNNLLNDLNDLIKFFNKLKRTRAYLYESTNAEFDNNMNFVKYDSDDQLPSIEDESSESSKRNQTEIDPKNKYGSFTDSSDEENQNPQIKKQYTQDDFIDTSNESSLEREKQINSHSRLKKNNSAEQYSDRSQQFDYEVNSQTNSIITEEDIENSNEIDIQPGTMNLDRIQQSKLYKPLLNIQNSIITDKDYLLIFNDMVIQFNIMISSEDLVQTAIRKIQNRKIKIGTYHYPSEYANLFLEFVQKLEIYLEEEDGHDLLIDDLKLVINTFKVFISTRQFYHEPFSAILVDNNDKEISKPLLDFDLDNLNLDDFSLLSDQDDNHSSNKKGIIQLSKGDSKSQDSSQSNESVHKNIVIKSHPIDLSLEESSEEVQDQNNLNKKQQTVQKLERRSSQSNESSEQKNIEITDMQTDNKEDKEVKRKRKIYVIEILVCEDCVQNNYVTHFIE